MSLCRYSFAQWPRQSTTRHWGVHKSQGHPYSSPNSDRQSIGADRPIRRNTWGFIVGYFMPLLVSQASAHRRYLFTVYHGDGWELSIRFDRAFFCLYHFAICRAISLWQMQTDGWRHLLKLPSFHGLYLLCPLCRGLIMAAILPKDCRPQRIPLRQNKGLNKFLSELSIRDWFSDANNAKHIIYCKMH